MEVPPSRSFSSCRTDAACLAVTSLEWRPGEDCFGACDLAISLIWCSRLLNLCRSASSALA